MKAPELILTNGKVYSVKLNDEIVRGEAVAVREGKILKIGNKEEIMNLAGENTEITEAASLHSSVGSAEGLGRILNNQGMVCVSNGADFCDFAWSSIEVSDHDKTDVRIEFKRLFQCNGIHVPRVPLGVNENRFPTLIGHRVDRGIESHVTAENFSPLQGAMANLRLAVELFAGEFHRQVQCGCAACKPNGTVAADLLCSQTLYFIDVLANGADPVGADGLVDPLLLFAVHGGRRKPYFFLKRLNCQCDILLIYVDRPESVLCA